MKSENIRRSITISSLLDNKINLMNNEYSYKSKNDLIVELLELGILKFEEDEKIKRLLYTLIQRLDILLNEISSRN